MAGMAPGPRASFNMAVHRQRAVLFGGITDQPGKVRTVRLHSKDTFMPQQHLSLNIVDHNTSKLKVELRRNNCVLLA